MIWTFPNQPKASRDFRKGRISSDELTRRLSRQGLLVYQDEKMMDCLVELFDEQCEADASAERQRGVGGSRKRKWEA